jgi:MoxR-like ATPase
METETTESGLERRLEFVRESFSRIMAEVGRVIVGQEEIVEGILVCLLCGGHALLEGVPGVGKTSIIRVLGMVLDLKTARIQFTPDLMPADILGTTILVQEEGAGRVFRFQKGPVFAHIVLADEINRATPKTQSALLEAMQEQRVTIGGATYELDSPFIVLATQNPIEMEGTYPLPEAQLDRFFFKLLVRRPDAAQMARIIDRTTSDYAPALGRVWDRGLIEEIRELVRRVPIAGHVREYCIRLVQATHPDSPDSPEAVRRYVRYGSSPRGAQSLVLAGKTRALLAGRYNVSLADVRTAVLPALRHRLILNFEGEAEGVSAEGILEEILSCVQETPR